MTERQVGIEPDLSQAEKLSTVLIAEISDTRELISAIKSTAGWLTNEDYQSTKDLHKKTDANLITLLKLRQGTTLEQEISVEVEMSPGETIHPFSENRITVCLPSPKYQGSVYKVYANLSDLKGNDVRDSVEVMRVIGKNITVVDIDKNILLQRIKRELRRINAERELVKKGESRYSLEELNVLAASVIEQRRLALLED